jgi:ketosteroid isomerase-like protein
MGKQSFAEAATASDPNTDFQLDCVIQEIRIFGDHAWLMATISLAMTDKKTNTRSLMKGDGISILERRGDGWVVVRDANTMIAVPAE